MGDKKKRPTIAKPADANIDWSQKTALITGANRGIGLGVALQLAHAGCAVILGCRDTELGEEAALQLRNEGLRVRVEKVDVSDEQSVKDCARRLKDAGVDIDILINNAGIYDRTDIYELSTETFMRCFAPIPWGRCGAARPSSPA
jgi:NAD(P)-dependent dehydrogenase (short-subunit alcohol dehydrogenase family)